MTAMNVKAKKTSRTLKLYIISFNARSINVLIKLLRKTYNVNNIVYHFFFEYFVVMYRKAISTI